MSGVPAVIGSTVEDQVNYGETIDLTITYKDQGGLIDLSQAVVTVSASVPPVIKLQAEITVVDAVNGKVRLLLHRDDALKLRRGRNNWFCLKAVFGTESDDVTPEIYIEVT